MLESENRSFGTVVRSFICVVRLIVSYNHPFHPLGSLAAGATLLNLTNQPAEMHPRQLTTASTNGAACLTI
jgi:hypothetical protein